MHGDLFILNAKPCTTTVYVAAIQPTIDHSVLPDIPTLAYAAKSKNTMASLKTWHCQLSHAKRDAVKRLEQQKMVRGMEINDMSINSNDSPCSLCLHGKQTQAPIPWNSNIDNPCLLHCIYSDICSPMCTTALMGEHLGSQMPNPTM
jgi:hypothetical protein